MHTSKSLFPSMASGLLSAAGRKMARGWARSKDAAGGPALLGRECGMEALESRQMLAVVSWTGGGGDNQWTTAGNWSNGAVPTSADDVTVDVAGNPTIMFNGVGGPVSVRSLLSRENITFQLNTFNVVTTATFDGGAVARVQGGKLNGGTWSFTGTGSRILPTSGRGELNNMQIEAELVVPAHTNITVRGTTRFTLARLMGDFSELNLGPEYTLNDTIVTDGTATGTRYVKVSDGGPEYSFGNVTIGQTGVIRLAAGTPGNLVINNGLSTLTNNGLITAESPGRMARIDVGPLTNNGLIQVTAGTLVVNGAPLTNSTTGTLLVSGGDSTLEVGSASLVNQGSVSLTDGTLNLASAFSDFNFAGLTRSGGSFILSGQYTVNGTFSLNAQTGSLLIQNGAIIGGTLNLSDGAELLFGGMFGAALRDVTVQGELLLRASSIVTLLGTTTFTAARLTGDGANLRLGDGYTLVNPVIAEGSATGTRTVSLSGNDFGVRTIGPTGSIRLAPGCGGGLNIAGNTGAETLLNNGSISSEAAGQTLAILSSVRWFTNNATIALSSGSFIVNTGTTFANAATGVMSATGANATLSVVSMWSNAGTITITDATLNLGGTFGNFNFPGFTRSGGTVNLSGTFNNPGLLALNASTGSWRLLGGSIIGGSLTLADGSTLIFTGSGGTLNNLALGGEVVLGPNEAVAVLGTTSFSAARLTGGGANLRIGAGVTISVPVIAEGSGTGTRTVTLGSGAAGNATIASSGTIRLAAGTGGGLTINNDNPSTLINNGVIETLAAGQTLRINNSRLTVSATGSISAGAGAILTIVPTNWTNAGALSVTDTTLTMGGNIGSFNIAGFTRSGGVVNLIGAYTNSGTLALNAATGTWNLIGGSIIGGSLTFADGSTLVYSSSGGTLNSVAVAGEIVLDAGISVRVQGTTTFSAARLIGGGATLNIAPGYTLGSPVTAEGAASGTRVVNLVGGSGGAVTIGVGGSIRLAAETGGGLNLTNTATATLVNNGLISAEAAGQTFSIANAVLTNNGTARVLSGTLVVTSTTATNSAAGTLTATGANSIFTLTPQNLSNAGAVNLTDATLTIGGTFGTFNVPAFVRSGGTVNLVGTFNSSGNFTLNAATGSWQLLGGTINNGSISFADGSLLVYTSAGGVLNNITLNGEIVLDSDAAVRISGTTVFAGARLIGGGANLSFAPGYTLNTTVTAEGAATGTRFVTVAAGGNGTVTIAQNGVIRLAAGSGGGLTLANAASATLMNNGLISAEATGQTLSINNSTFTNSGTVQSLAGTLGITAALTNVVSGTLTGRLWRAVGGTIISSSPISRIALGTTVEFGIGGIWNATSALNTNNGTFRLLDGRVFATTTVLGFTNNGSLELAAGSTLSLTGPFVQGSNGSLRTTVASADPLTGYGRVSSAGAVTLGGSLAVSFAAGYAPQIGDAFTVVDGSGVTGQFATVTLPDLAENRKIAVLTPGSAVRLLFTHIADFNNDGVLNADDLSDFITGYFDVPANGATDFNHDGVINADDLSDFIAAFFG